MPVSASQLPMSFRPHLVSAESSPDLLMSVVVRNLGNRVYLALHHHLFRDSS